MKYKDKIKWIQQSVEKGLITEEQGKEEQAIILADLWLKNPGLMYKGATDTMIRITGTSNVFRCDCGCNVFRENNITKGVYMCNCCNKEYEEVKEYA